MKADGPVTAGLHHLGAQIGLYLGVHRQQIQPPSDCIGRGFIARRDKGQQVIDRRFYIFLIRLKRLDQQVKKIDRLCMALRAAVGDHVMGQLPQITDRFLAAQPFQTGHPLRQPHQIEQRHIADIVGEPSHPLTDILLGHGLVPREHHPRDIGERRLLRRIRYIDLARRARKEIRQLVAGLGKMSGQHGQVARGKKRGIAMPLRAPFLAFRQDHAVADHGADDVMCKLRLGKATPDTGQQFGHHIGVTDIMDLGRPFQIALRARRIGDHRKNILPRFFGKVDQPDIGLGQIRLHRDRVRRCRPIGRRHILCIHCRLLAGPRVAFITPVFLAGKQ